jgi:hypothetical protein
MPIIDTCIRLAQRDICAIRWTAHILEEADRNLIANRDDEDKIRRRCGAPQFAQQSAAITAVTDPPR